MITRPAGTRGRSATDRASCSIRHAALHREGRRDADVIIVIIIVSK